MNFLERDGAVALIISPGFGAGWSTWASEGNKNFLLYDRELALCCERRDFDAMRALCEAHVPTAYLGGLKDCELEWLPKGQPFVVVEYDGSETILTQFLKAGEL